MRTRIGHWTAVMLIALAVGGCGPKKTETTETRPVEKAVRNVEVVTSRAGQLEERLRLTGHLEAFDKAEINARLTGQIAQVLVREGDPVQAGQPVLMMQSTDLRARVQQAATAVEAARARLRQARAGHGLTGTQVDLEVRRVAQGIPQAEANLHKAEAELADARKDFERQKGLFNEGAVPQIRIDQAELRYNVALRNTEAARSAVKAARETLEMARANVRQTEVSSADAAAAAAAVQQAQAALEGAQTDLNDAVVRSPITGVVVKRLIEPGMTTSAMAGRPLLIVADNRALELSAPLDEKYSRLVHRGTTVQVETRVLDQPVPGTVVEMVPAADPSTHTVRVRIRINNPSSALIGGAFATATLVADTHEGVLVPRDAVQRRGGEGFVFVDDGGVARRHDVTVAYESPRQAVVTKGIKAGVSVITLGAAGLEDGQKVHVGQPAPAASGATASPAGSVPTGSSPAPVASSPVPTPAASSAAPPGGEAR